jgi:hypothetical protein
MVNFLFHHKCPFVHCCKTLSFVFGPRELICSLLIKLIIRFLCFFYNRVNPHGILLMYGGARLFHISLPREESRQGVGLGRDLNPGST